VRDIELAFDAVLGAEYAYEVDARRIVKQLDGAATVTSKAGVICYQSDVRASELPEVVTLQYVNSGQNRIGLGKHDYGDRKNRKQ
jgi:hypothetical protein